MSEALRLVLFGHPVHHSRSAELFRACQEAGGPRVDYELLDTRPEDLSDAMDALRAGRWDGANVTIPHKLAAAGLVDELDDEASRASAVNVLVRRKGRLLGANSDGVGFLASLEGLPRRATILGAGGAARGVAAALARKQVVTTVVSRRPDATSLVCGRVIGWDDPSLAEEIHGSDLLVQATPVGMHPNSTECPKIPLDAIREGQRVVDLIYRPWETVFLREARARGARALNGWPMLVHQAAAALDLWLGPGAGDGLVAAARVLESGDPKAPAP